MPTRDDHVRQAEQNEALVDSVLMPASAHEDWQVTALFYAAVHYVEAYLAMTQNMHTKRHAQREWLVSAETNLRRISIDYFELKQRSIDSRYECITFPPGFAKTLHANEFAAVRGTIRPLV